MYKFSKSSNGFYVEGLHKSIPDDAVDITAEDYSNLMSGQAKGLNIESDQNGFPVLINQLGASKDDVLSAGKIYIREKRTPILDALTGIAGRAYRSGNAELADEADNLSKLLLDMTDDDGINSSKTHEEMNSAISNAFKRFSNSSSEGLKAVFRNVTDVG